MRIYHSVDVKMQIDDQKLKEPGYGDFGLTNPGNKLNCFINSVLQILWHIDSLRTAFEMVNKIQDKKSPEAKVIFLIVGIFSEAY